MRTTADRLPGSWWLCLAVLGSALFSLAWLRHDTLHNQTFDLALYVRMSWGFARGELWSPLLDVHAFGIHVSPVLPLLGLLAVPLGSAPVLLSSQALCMSLAAWPLALLARRHLGPPGPWMALCAWALYPNIWHVASYEFHPSNLAVLPMAWAMDGLDRRDGRTLAWSILGLLVCREDMLLPGATLALVHCLRQRDRWSLALLLLTVATFLGLWLGVVARHAPALASSTDLHFGVWGGSPAGVVRALFERPGDVLAHFLEPSRLSYLPRLLLPLCCLSLWAPSLLVVALPTLALNLTSVFPTTLHAYSHYLSPAVPVIVAAALVGAGRFQHRRGWWSLPAISLLVAQLWVGGSPLSAPFVSAHFREDGASRAGRAIMNLIEPGLSVQAPDALLPHLAERVTVRRAPPPDMGAAQVVLDLSHRQRYAHREDLLRTLEEPSARRWLARSDHGLLLHAPPYALLRRGAQPRQAPGVQRYFVQTPPRQAPPLRLTDCLKLALAELHPDTGALALEFQAVGPCPSDLALRLGSGLRPRRVDLLFDGALSPAQLRAGDRLRSMHPLDERELRAYQRGQLRVGVLRSSGVRPLPEDPVALTLRPGCGRDRACGP